MTIIHLTISVANSSTQVLISDSVWNQTLITSEWMVIKRHQRFAVMSGAFADRNTGQQFQVVLAACLLTSSDGVKYCVYAHDALYDGNSNKKESLLSTHCTLTTLGWQFPIKWHIVRPLSSKSCYIGSFTYSLKRPYMIFSVSCNIWLFLVHIGWYHMQTYRPINDDIGWLQHVI